jgi:hypothetical protein
VAISDDISTIVNQWNTIAYPLFATLVSIEGTEALTLGLAGDTIYTSIQATLDGSSCYWNSDDSRAKSIKESFDYLLSEIVRIDNSIAMLSDLLSYDDTEVRDLISALDTRIDVFEASFEDHSDRHIFDAEDEIDGDRLAIDYSPTNYSPDVAPAEVDDVKELTSHLAGIDNVIGELSDDIDQDIFGQSYLLPEMFSKPSGAAGPDVTGEELADMAFNVLRFDAASSEYAWATVPVPFDGGGSVPTRMTVIGNFTGMPAGGAYPGGTGFAFSLRVSAPGGATGLLVNGNITSNTSISNSWTNSYLQTVTGLDASSMDKNYVCEWSGYTFGSLINGFINLKLTRETTDASDNWADDVGLISLQVLWYR